MLLRAKTETTEFAKDAKMLASFKGRVAITSRLPYEDMVKAQRYAPSTLSFNDGTTTLFALGFAEGCGSKSDKGIVFNRVNHQGYPEFVFDDCSISDDPEKASEELEAKYGLIIGYIKAIEDQVMGAMDAINGKCAESHEAIEVLG